MALTVGSRLAEYEIVALLGEGGMGAVFRARDHRLRRDVAIKVLTRPPGVAADSARHLLEEARHAAGLNHPHICTIHEVADHDGVPFIVMELVEGRRLADMIPGDGLPADAVARYGAQVADALAHAHDRGIIHRDLKSTNVIVTPDGRVKVLDFGIAVALDRREDDRSTAGVELGGGTAGTLGYMAPEVLSGGPASAASDIWALGVLLYEMAAGRLPFAGATPAVTVSQILQQPPPPLPARVPATVTGIIQRCLARAPGERYQHAREVRAALDIVRDMAGQSTDSSAARLVVPPARPRRMSAKGATAWTAVAVVAIALAAWAWTSLRTREGRFSVSDQRPVAGFGNAYRQGALSPDGGFVAFVDAGKPVPQIWVKNLTEGPPIQITSGDVPASHPAWSPKNDQIVFARRGQGLWSVPPLGGTARRLLDSGLNPRFSSDGERLVFERGRTQIWTARADGSGAKRVEGIPEPWYATGLFPSFSPDGASIAFVLSVTGPNGDLWIVPSEGGTPRQLTFDLTEVADPVWTSDGRFIVFSSMRGGSRTLWRISPQGGQPEPVTVGAGEDIEPEVSRDTRALVYTNVRNQFRLAAYDLATGRERQILEQRREAIWPRFSPDGTKVAFFGVGDQGDVQVFVTPSSGGAVEQATHGKGQINTMPRWAPDGSFIYYFAQQPKALLARVPAGGGESVEFRPWRWENHTHAEFSPDGKTIAYLRQALQGEKNIAPATIVHDVDSGAERTLPTPMTPTRWSPDGRTIAGTIQSRSPVIGTCPADGGECRRLTAGRYPVWSRDGARIYFLRDTSDPATKELWSIAPDGTDEKKLLDRMGPFRPIDVTFDVSPSGEVVWNQFVEGRYELWQARLR